MLKRTRRYDWSPAPRTGEETGPALPCLGGEPYTRGGGPLRRGAEWDLTPPAASETNSHKSHTTQGLTTPRATCSQLSEGSHRTRCATHMIIHLPSPSPLAPAGTRGTHTQTQRQKVGQPLTFSRQFLIQCDLRNLFSEKGVGPLKKDGHHPGALTGMCYFLLNVKLCGFLFKLKSWHGKMWFYPIMYFSCEIGNGGPWWQGAGPVDMCRLTNAWVSPPLVMVLEVARPGRGLWASTTQESTQSATSVLLILVGFTHQ